MKKTELKLEGKTLLAPVWLARDPFSRFLGLMGRAGLSSGEALLFPRCNSIHTLFMRFAIDVVFIDYHGIALETTTANPWRFLMPRWHASHTLELGQGEASRLGITAGKKLTCPEVWS